MDTNLLNVLINGIYCFALDLCFDCQPLVLVSSYASTLGPTYSE